MVEEGILEHVHPGGSKCASPIVVLRRSDGNLRICDDFKIGINHKIWSDSFPFSNIETAVRKLSGIEYCVKIDLKSTYNQIQIDNQFNEITKINTT